MRLFVISPTVGDIGYHERDLMNERNKNTNKENNNNNMEGGDDLKFLLSPNNTTTTKQDADEDDMKDIFNQVEKDLNLNEIKSNDMMELDNIDFSAGDFDDILSSSSGGGSDTGGYNSSSGDSVFDITIPDDNWRLDDLSMDYIIADDDGLL